MPTVLKVAPMQTQSFSRNTRLPHGTESQFDTLQIVHDGCTGTAISKIRNSATDLWMLNCGCGLKVEFKNQGPAYWLIMRTAATQEPTTLREGSTSSSIHGDILLLPS
jgi:hypothetical protein